MRFAELLLMNNLQGKKIIVGITGSIAAYKSAVLIRLLIKSGAEVRVVMTPSATHFITPLTISTLSKNTVFVDVIDKDSWNNHVELGIWGDAFVIAPATANTIGKLANGICDSVIGAVYLSARCPIYFAPAMDADMWLHPSVKKNLHTLSGFGNHIIPVGHGELASGLRGDGRMAEPEEIAAFLSGQFQADHYLSGKKILITAGPTYEPIDPVRFIGNRSTGKMGIEIANAAINMGAKVDLVLGPSNLDPHPEVVVHNVQTAADMYQKAKSLFPNIDIAIFTAAVSDYAPENPALEKIKKQTNTLEIQLIKTPDIAFELGKAKSAGQITVGFALETNNEEENAKKKLQKKNFDLIVLNSLKDKGAGFQHSTNKITIFHKNGDKIAFDLKSKAEVAKDILQELLKLLMINPK